jgi:hypothetical protein
MRQVSSPVRWGAGRKGRQDLARSLPGCHATGLRLLLWIPHVPGPSMTAYARHICGTLGFANSIRLFSENPWQRCPDT